MLKRGLMLVLFLVLLSSVVCAAFQFSTLKEPSPAFLFEGSLATIKLRINNLDQPKAIKEICASIPNVNITNVTLRADWLENHNATFVQWFNDTVGNGSENDAFDFGVFVLPIPENVTGNITVTLVVTKINEDNTTVPENHNITILDDATPPNILSINPSNATLANSIQIITANVVEAESQLQTVNYTYGDCNGANITITLSCNGSICTGTANFTSFDEGDVACYAIYVENNVGENATQTGNLTFHGVPPNVTAVTPTAGTIYTESDAIYITANATDDTNVSKVRADVTYPNGTTKQILLNPVAGTNKYSRLFNAPNLMGQYNVTIVANDTAGNINNTETTHFKIVPDYAFSYTLNPSTARPGRTVRISGAVKLSNGSDIPENHVTIDIRGTETNVTLTGGAFSHTFNAPQNIGLYNIYVKVYANSGYNYSSMKTLTVSNPDTSSSGNGWGWDFDEFEGYETEGAGVAQAPEEATETVTEDEDAGVAKAPEQESAGTIIEEEQTPEEVIDEILSKPNQVTGSAVGLGGKASLLALLLLLLGIGTLAYSNTRIRQHLHTFAKERIGTKFKKKEETKGFSEEEWEDYFKKLRGED